MSNNFEEREKATKLREVVQATQTPLFCNFCAKEITVETSHRYYYYVAPRDTGQITYDEKIGVYVSETCGEPLSFHRDCGLQFFNEGGLHDSHRKLVKRYWKPWYNPFFILWMIFFVFWLFTVVMAILELSTR